MSFLREFLVGHSMEFHVWCAVAIGIVLVSLHWLVTRFLFSNGKSTDSSGSEKLDCCDRLLLAVAGANDSIVTSLLSRHRFPPSILDSAGLSPVHLPAQLGRFDVVRQLVAHGLWPHQPDASGRSPADYAQRAGHNDIATYLRGLEGGPTARPWTPLLASTAEPDGGLTITSLNIYPVKSCQGVAVSRVVFDRWGFVNDRRFVIIDDQGLMMSQRRCPRMAWIIPDISADGMRLTLNIRTSKQPLVVDVARILSQKPLQTRRAKIWKDIVDVDDMGDEAAEWLARHMDTPGVRLTRMASHNYQRNVEATSSPMHLGDAYPFLLVSEPSLADLNTRLGEDRVDAATFRPNIVVAGPALRPWREDSWGRVVIQGSTPVEFANLKPCGRCRLTTVLRHDASFHPHEQPLATLREFRMKEGEACFGVQMCHQHTDDYRLSIAVGDRVFVELGPQRGQHVQ